MPIVSNFLILLTLLFSLMIGGSYLLTLLSFLVSDSPLTGVRSTYNTQLFSSSMFIVSNWVWRKPWAGPGGIKDRSWALGTGVCGIWVSKEIPTQDNEPECLDSERKYTVSKSTLISVIVLSSDCIRAGAPSVSQRHPQWALDKAQWSLGGYQTCTCDINDQLCVSWWKLLPISPP